MTKFKNLIHYLIYIFIFFLPFQTRLIYKQGFLNKTDWEYGTLSIYATEILLMLIFIFSIIFILKTIPKKNLKWNQEKGSRLFLLFLLIIGFILHSVVAISPSLAFYKLTFLTSAVALVFIILVLKPKFLFMAWAFVFSGVFQAIIALNQFITQEIAGNKWLGMASQDPQTLGVPIVELGGTRWLRTFGTMPHPNILAGLLLVSLFLIIGLYVIDKSKKSQKALPLFFVINFLALMTTLSRGALLSFAVVIILTSFWNKKEKILAKSTTKFALIAILIIVLFSVSFPELITNRVTSNSYVENLSNNTRLAQYQEFGSIFSNSFFLGTGLGNYTLVQYTNNPTLPGFIYQPIHNTYLLIIAELGFIGILIVAFFIMCLIKAFGNYKKWNTKELIAYSCLFALAITALFDHYLWSFYFGIMFLAIIISLPLLTKQEK